MNKRLRGVNGGAYSPHLCRDSGVEHCEAGIPVYGAISVPQNFGSQAASAHTEQDDVAIPFLADLPYKFRQVIQMGPKKLSCIQPSESVRDFPGILTPDRVVSLITDSLRDTFRSTRLVAEHSAPPLRVAAFPETRSSNARPHSKLSATYQLCGLPPPRGRP